MTSHPFNNNNCSRDQEDSFEDFFERQGGIENLHKIQVDNLTIGDDDQRKYKSKKDYKHRSRELRPKHRKHRKSGDMTNKHGKQKDKDAQTKISDQNISSSDDSYSEISEESTSNENQTENQSKLAQMIKNRISAWEDKSVGQREEEIKAEKKKMIQKQEERLQKEQKLIEQIQKQAERRQQVAKTLGSYQRKSQPNTKPPDDNKWVRSPIIKEYLRKDPFERLALTNVAKSNNPRNLTILGANPKDVINQLISDEDKEIIQKELYGEKYKN
ncbi:MAG: hypothetical protein EZS28_007678 [Streblomastix strix]|uniref:Uncharacterized protein n=1 Tax=Streblomastix strix TaxID=222440 RepID=A0A5J4WQY5_9EUKA|nr:MAG: hypothetical protein EZS28_007678 [Streblomastix strix]